jgi:signal transduction histidine kinase/ActR/RegA family two-component response regulator
MVAIMSVSPQGISDIADSPKSEFRRTHSLRLVFAAVVALPVLLLFGIVIVETYYASRLEAEANLRKQMVQEIKSKAKTLNHHLTDMARFPDQIALAITIRKPENVDEMLTFQYSMLAENPRIYGGVVGWEPFAFDPNEKYFCPYVWRDDKKGGAVSAAMLDPANPENEYDYFDEKWDWYADPKKKYIHSSPDIPLVLADKTAKLPRMETGLWCDPFFDEGGGDVLMTTYSAPFFLGRKFAGVVTCDVTIDWMTEFLADETFDGGMYVLLSAKGVVISHPDESRLMKKLEEVDHPYEKEDWQELTRIVGVISDLSKADFYVGNLPDDEHYLRGLSRTLHGTKQGQTLLLEGVQLPSNNWILLCAVPQKEAYRAANERLRRALLTLLCGLFLIGLYLYSQVNRRILRPIRRLADATDAVASGNFGHRINVDITSGNELAEVSYNFNRMTQTLQDTMAAAVKNAADRQAAEESSKTKSAFLANMSHEIRTPMNGIIGLADMLANSNLDEQQHQYIDLIRSSADALLTVINDILDHSKIEAGKLLIESYQFDLQRLLRELSFSFSYTAQQKSVEFVTTTPPEVPQFVQGDANRLRQVLNNFLSNAIKFTPANGKVELKVIPLTDPEKPEWIRFEVSDSGIGMTEEQLARLFKPFEQADTSTTRKYGGTGLGLVISKRLIEMMGGNIGSQSKYGSGSVFWCELPLPVTTEDESIAGKKSSIMLQPSRPLNILLVDDVKVNLIVLSSMLQHMGHITETATNGKQAIDLMRKHRYDMVFMDCQMPEMDGYECTQQVRVNETSILAPKVPIIAVTAHAMTGDKDRCLASGMDDYISKPIDHHELQSKLAKWAPR